MRPRGVIVAAGALAALTALAPLPDALTDALPDASTCAHAEPTRKRAAPFTITTEVVAGPDAVDVHVRVEPLVPLATLRVTLHGLDGADRELEERPVAALDAPVRPLDATAVMPRSPALVRVFVRVDATLPGGGDSVSDVKEAWSVPVAPRGVTVRGRDGRPVLELPGVSSQGPGPAQSDGAPPNPSPPR